MLKYTLGMILALVILGVTGFVVIAKVTDGDAGSGPAPEVIAVLYDDHISPPIIEVKRDQIIDLRLDNQATEARTVLIGGEGVEQLPQLSTSHDAVPFTEPRPYVAVDVSAARSETVLVRFTKKGEYELGVFALGTFRRLYNGKIVVK